MTVTVGFIGLGLMGLGFVERLIAEGYAVVGTDLKPEARAAAERLGARTVASAADVAAEADHVLICVTTPLDDGYSPDTRPRRVPCRSRHRFRRRAGLRRAGSGESRCARHHGRWPGR